MATIKQGDVLPSLSLPTFDGRTFNSAEHSDSHLLMIFFRDASCPFCNMYLKELSDDYQFFKSKGLQIITFFASSGEEIKKYAGKNDVHFYIIPGPDLAYYKMFDVRQSRMGLWRTLCKSITVIKAMFIGFFNLNSINKAPIIPSDFLISKGGKVDLVHHSDDYADHLSIMDIKHWLSKQE
ncbi:MAG: peroxiredoxin [Candidatus Endobugula sp.]|jgi:peroxiredoxin